MAKQLYKNVSILYQTRFQLSSLDVL